MSAGHKGHQHDLSQAELDSLLDHALADPRIKKRLARSFKLDCEHDIALLGSSSIGGGTVFFDRHLKYKNWPYGVIPVQYRRLDVKPGLIRHERLEQALEDIFGWPYLPLAHFVAQHWEERYYKSKGFDPALVERAFKPFIKADEAEKIVKTPTNLDKRPLIAPPRDTKILARIEVAEQKEKRTHESVKYTDKAMNPAQKCEKCEHYISNLYGGPACTLIQSEVASGGWCRRFRPGVLGSTEDK